MTAAEGAGIFAGYDAGLYYCELTDRRAAVEPLIAQVAARIEQLGVDDLRARARDAETELYNLGITFTVYSQGDVIDRILPFDVVPRVIPAADWRSIEAGVVQRVTTINRFLHDLYHDQKFLKDGIIPAKASGSGLFD